MTRKSTEKQDRPDSPPEKRGGPRFPAMTGRLLAVGIFALGAGAFVAAGYLGYVRFFRAAEPAVSRLPAGDTARIASEQKADGLCPDCGAGRLKPPESLPAGARPAAEQALAGGWRFDAGAGRGLLQIGEGAFQLIYAYGEAGRLRKYVRGVYNYDAQTGVLALEPRRDFGAPAAIRGVQYEVLTYRPYKVRVYESGNGGDLFWVPHVEGARRGQVHPLFAYTGTGEAAIRWQPDA